MYVNFRFPFLEYKMNYSTIQYKKTDFNVKPSSNRNVCVIRGKTEIREKNHDYTNLTTCFMWKFDKMKWWKTRK